MADKKRVTRRKPKPVLILRVPPAGSVERHEFPAKIRQQLRAAQSPNESSPR